MQKRVRVITFLLLQFWQLLYYPIQECMQKQSWVKKKKHWRLSLGSKVNNVDNEVEIDVNIVTQRSKLGRCISGE